MKKRVALAAGILLIVCGAAVFLYPIIKQAYSSYQQKKIMEEVKAEILSNLNSVAAETTPMVPSPTPESSESDIQPSPTAEGDGPFAGFVDIKLDEKETEAEVSVLESDRLRGQKPVGIIEIEKIDLIYAIVEGVDTWNIGVAIGHFPESAAIGAEGNCAMAGHRGGTSGSYFRDIDDLEEGDEILLTNLDGEEFTYLVTESMVVEPTDTYVVDDLGVDGKYLTLVTCTNNGTLRLIVRARIQEDSTE